MTEALKALANGHNLSSAQAEDVMRAILRGDSQPEQVGALLATLHFRPPNGATLAGFVRAFRSEALETCVSLSDLSDAIDVCGTGGDGAGTFNISTAVAFVAASCGQVVAKHGNRAVSSACGSFDVLEVLGVPFADTVQEARESLMRHGLAFLYAPSFHPAMRKLAPLRKILGMRTVFNVLGPLLNPARVQRQLIGVYSEALVIPVAEALLELGSRNVLVVHGLDGSDELSLNAPSVMAHLKAGRVEVSRFEPESLGLNRVPPYELAGGDARTNARILREIFSGERGPREDIVALNAAAALVVGEKVASLREGLAVSREALRLGRTLAVLNKMSGVEVSAGAAS